MTEHNSNGEWKDRAITVGIIAGVLIILWWILKMLWCLVVTLAPHLVSTIVIVAFAVIIVLSLGLICVGVSYALFSAVVRWGSERFARLEAADAEILRQLRKQSPSFVVATALAADCILAITDKVFADKAMIVGVTRFSSYSLGLRIIYLRGSTGCSRSLSAGFSGRQVC
jgi:hypothetical protein